LSPCFDPLLMPELMDQDTETTRKPLSTFEENIRGSLKRNKNNKNRLF